MAGAWPHIDAHTTVEIIGLYDNKQCLIAGNANSNPMVIVTSTLRMLPVAKATSSVLESLVGARVLGVAVEGESVSPTLVGGTGVGESVGVGVTTASQLEGSTHASARLAEFKGTYVAELPLA